MTSYTSQPTITTSTAATNTSLETTLLARLERRLKMLENLEKSALEQDMFVPSLYKETVKNTLPVLSDLLRVLEQEHVADITEDDWNNNIDDIIQHRMAEQEEWNRKWKQLEELATIINTRRDDTK